MTIATAQTAAALAALDATIASATAARELLLAGGTLAPAPGPWVTLDEAHDLTGIKPSRGEDPHRTLRGWLKDHMVKTSRAGRAVLVSRASLLTAIDAQASAPAPVPPVPSDAALLARHGGRFTSRAAAGAPGAR